MYGAYIGANKRQCRRNNWRTNFWEEGFSEPVFQNFVWQSQNDWNRANILFFHWNFVQNRLKFLNFVLGRIGGSGASGDLNALRRQLRVSTRSLRREIFFTRSRILGKPFLTFQIFFSSQVCFVHFRYKFWRLNNSLSVWIFWFCFFKVVSDG